jgi:HEAT repeat protein
MLILLSLLWALQDPSIPALVEKLGSEKVEEREEATRRLKVLGRPAEGALREAAKSRDPEVSSRSRLLLRRLEIQTKLSSELKSTFPGIEDRLAGGDDHEWTEILLKATSTNKEFERVYPHLGREDLEALGSLAILGASTSKEKLRLCSVINKYKLGGIAAELQLYLHDKDPDVRSNAARTIALRGGREAAPTLIELTRDPDHRVCSSAAIALGILGVKEAVPNVLLLLKDPREYVKGEAVLALGLLRVEQTVPDITALLSDGNLYWYCLRALSELGATQATPQIIPLLQDKAAIVRVEAARTLAQLGSTQAANDLAKLLRDEDPAVRCMAALSLGQLRAKATASGVALLFEDEYPVVRAFAAQAIGRMGDSAALPRLRKLLKENNALVRSEAALSLARLGAVESAADLKRMLSDNEKVREAWDNACKNEKHELSDFVLVRDDIEATYGEAYENVTVGFIAAAALCNLGSRSGLEPFCKGLQSTASGFNPIALNALRDSEAWAKLADKRINRAVSGKVNDLLEVLAKNCEIQISYEVKILENVNDKHPADWPRWSWVEGTPVLEALERMLWERGCTVIMERTGLRVIQQDVARAQYLEWWKKDQK